jgi:Cytochrome c554 and c-prime
MRLRVATAVVAVLGAAAAAVVPLACDTHSSFGPTVVPVMTRAQLLDSNTCATCHGTTHFHDWSQSMHAYASKDPVFLAMNARGQRETGGKLGTFCVQCHAPMAVRDGMTTDGLNLSSLPAVYQQGVSCFFCHSVESVGSAHGDAALDPDAFDRDASSLDNAAVNLASDLVMRGEYPNSESPAALTPNTAHASAYSPLHDHTQLQSGQLCGACHDVVSPAGGDIERTYYEWAHSVYSTAAEPTTCGASGCHMNTLPSATPIASGPGFTAPARTVHEHDFPGVDVALDPNFTNASVERGVVQQKLDNFTLQGAVCVTALGGIRVVLDAVAVGHQWPSGATQDRRAWVQVQAFRDGALVYQSGVVPDGGTPTEIANDPDLWLLRDCMFGPDGGQVDMFWQAASIEGNELPALASTNGLNNGTYTHRTQLYPRNASPLMVDGGVVHPDQVTVSVWIQPVGLDVLADLVDSGDLEAGVLGNMPVFQVSLNGPDTEGSLTWTPDASKPGYQFDPWDNTPSTCVTPQLANIGGALATDHTLCSP